MTSTDRQREFKKRMVAAGMKQLNIWVPVRHGGMLSAVARLLAEHPTYELATLRDTKTGRLVKIK